VRLRVAGTGTLENSDVDLRHAGRLLSTDPIFGFIVSQDARPAKSVANPCIEPVLCISVLIHMERPRFTLNPHSGTPIYRQLMDQVRWMVASSQLRPGDELPSVRELAVAHAVNAMTVSKAYSLLEAEGVLSRQRGKPMTVSTELAQRESKAARIERLDALIAPLKTAAWQLQLETDDVVAAVRAALEKKNV
jgi:GntR family transcriptional regulator